VQGLDLAPLAQAAGGYLALCPTNTAASKFVYDAYALKLQLPDEGVDAAAVVAAAKAALGEDSEIAAALESHIDLIKNRAALYIVHSDQGGVSVAGDANYAAYGDNAKWKLEKIDTDANYFAPAAEVEADGKYYTTLYAAFPFTIVNTGNVVAYDVMQILDGGKPFMEPIETTTIPALTPVLLEMTTNVDADNMLMPVLDSNAQGIGMMAETQQSMLEGTLFDDNTTYTGPTMLTLHEGLTFAADASLEFMPANKAWVNKDINTAISKIGNDDASGDDTIYDLMGRKVINPTHGIYIKNGKKVVF